LPGDAFFSAEFKKDLFAKKSETGALNFEYHRYAGEFMACGYAGYENLTVSGVPEAVLKNLQKVHTIAFAEFEKRAEVDRYDDTKTPYFPLYVYNRSFPLSSPFGVKYNENWVDEQTKEAGRGHAIYDELYGRGSTSLVIDDWASSKDIAPLKISAERKPMGKTGESGIVEEPIQANVKDVMFVILAGGDVAKFSRREEGMVFFVVTEKILRYRFDRKGVAMPQKIDAPVDDIPTRLAKITKDQRALRAALRVYALNFGKLPSDEQGLEILTTKSKSDGPEGWMPLLKKLPSDPWGRAYEWDGDVIFSLGADGFESRDDVVEPFDLGGEWESFYEPDQ